jgi:hypothetical protein
MNTRPSQSSAGCGPWPAEAAPVVHVPTYYVSWELVAAALRTELPDDMVFEAIPFPFDVMVFMRRREAYIIRPTPIVRSLFKNWALRHEGATNRGLGDADQNGFARA